jgi:hypothetical protein
MELNLQDGSKFSSARKKDMSRGFRTFPITWLILHTQEKGEAACCAVLVIGIKAIAITSRMMGDGRAESELFYHNAVLCLSGRDQFAG